MDKKGDVANRLDVNGRHLVDNPVLGEPRNTDCGTEQRSDDDARYCNTEGVDNTDEHRSRSAIRKDVDALSDLHTRRVGQPGPPEGDVRPLEVADCCRSECDEHDEYKEQHDKLCRPLQYRRVTPQRRLLMFAHLNGHATAFHSDPIAGSGRCSLGSTLGRTCLALRAFRRISKIVF